LRILDQDKGKDEPVRNVLLMLTFDEAKELRDSLDGLIERRSVVDHSHINDSEYKHEITIALYEPNGALPFSNMVKRLILEDH